MKFAENGDTVKIHYTGKLNSGEVFDSSEGRDPLEFQLGSGLVIEGFNDGILGMKEGEKKVLNIPSEKAYGERREEYLIDVAKDNLPPDLTPEVGMQLSMSSPDNNPIQVSVIEISNESIKIDANPPLAGKDLIFEVELLGVLKA